MAIEIARVFSAMTALTAIDLIAVAVFAITGALTASRKQLDIVAFVWLGVVTGVGGGTLRDLLLGVPVFWIQQPVFVVLSAAVAALVFFVAHVPQSRYRVLLWLDAVGLAFVSVAGAEKALAAGVGPTIAVVMGVITAAVGGIVRDVLGQEPSILLKKEIYITAALLGAVSYVAALGVGASTPVAQMLGIGLAFALRALAITRGWSLPTYRARRGRTAEELERLS
jgi:uncharacterized membrane protein YeiH